MTTHRHGSRRSAAIAGVLKALERDEGRPLRVADLCRIAQVSERTLRSMFLSELGVGPNRYLRLRRLHRIRAALSVTDPQHDTVASVAARFGCTDNGRMAAEYRGLFGEYPSETLNRPVRR